MAFLKDLALKVQSMWKAIKNNEHYCLDFVQI